MSVPAWGWTYSYDTSTRKKFSGNRKFVAKRSCEAGRRGRGRSKQQNYLRVKVEFDSFDQGKQGTHFLSVKTFHFNIVKWNFWAIFGPKFWAIICCAKHFYFWFHPNQFFPWPFGLATKNQKSHYTSGFTPNVMLTDLWHWVGISPTQWYDMNYMNATFIDHTGHAHD